ncbi:hypothetical protein FQN50_003066 [Emmonsiellopsis sp. PD_5]|nr:hypothetical protein FQN50_003066 [Emmonsiellopsis sp. PD_5]
MATSIPSTGRPTGPCYLPNLPVELVLEIAKHLEPSLSELLLEIARENTDKPSVSELALEIAGDKKSLSKFALEIGRDKPNLSKLTLRITRGERTLSELVPKIKNRLKPYISTLNALSRSCKSLHSVVDPLLYALDAEHQRHNGGTSQAINHAIEVLNIHTLQYALEAGASVRSMDHRITSTFWQALKKRAFLVNNDQKKQTEEKQKKVELLDQIIMTMITDGDADSDEMLHCHCTNLDECELFL